jgi:2-succinyl-6-hydroxy-2,4-cyclohexadiene-1-carboxylate synthase
LESRGFKKALLSTLRNFPFTNSPEVYSRLGNTNVPVLLFWGEFDQVIPFEQAELVSSAISQAKFIKIEGAGHNSQYEKPEKMLPELLKFLNK